MSKCLTCGAIAVGAIPNCGHSEPMDEDAYVATDDLLEDYRLSWRIQDRVQAKIIALLDGMAG